MIRGAILVYGNCQAAGVAGGLGKLTPLTDVVDIIFIPSFDHPINGAPVVQAKDLERCVLLVEQKTLWHQFPYAGQLATGTPVISFPLTACNALWPLQANDKRNMATPQYPWGRYPYGDRLVTQLLTNGLQGEELLDTYLATALDSLVDVRRFAALEMARMVELDAQCDIPMGTYFLQHMKDQRLFWTYNHPTSQLLRPLTEAVVARLIWTFGLPPKTVGLVGAIFENWEPDDSLKVAIHPRAAEQLGINWYSEELEYAHYEYKNLSYVDYLRHLIRFD